MAGKTWGPGTVTLRDPAQEIDFVEAWADDTFFSYKQGSRYNLAVTVPLTRVVEVRPR